MVAIRVAPIAVGAVVLMIDISTAIHAYGSEADEPVTALNFTGAGVSILKDSIFNAGVKKAAKSWVAIFVGRTMNAMGEGRALGVAGSTRKEQAKEKY